MYAPRSRGRVYPGWVGTGWAGRVLYRVPRDTLPGTHIQSYLASGPYLRPNKGLLLRFHEVSEIGSRKGPRIDPELTQNQPRIDPSRLVPRWPSDHPYPDLRKPMV